MASIRKRNGLWQAQVRSRKLGSTSKSFHKRTDAIACARVQEAAMQTGEWKPKEKRYSTTDDLIQKYLRKVTTHKKGAETETRRLKRHYSQADDLRARFKGPEWRAFVIRRGYKTARPVSSSFCLTVSLGSLDRNFRLSQPWVQFVS